MKEELLRVLKTKLDSIKVNIESLAELNGKIDAENEKLSYTDNILSIFKKDNNYNVLNFGELSKEDFDNVIEVLGGNVGDMFKTNSCNYDGLTYLINGINNGVSLSLTLEQENAINYFIQSLEGKCEEYEATIDGLKLVKDHFEISDIDLLNEKKSNYESVLDKISKDDYVGETDIVMEAIKFNNIETEKTIDMLMYLLKYNAEIYEKNKDKAPLHEEVVEPPKEEHQEPEVYEEEVKEEPVETKEENEEYEEFHFPEFENIKTDEEKEVKEEAVVTPPEKEEEENIFVPPEVSTENEKVEPLPVVDPIPMPDMENVIVPSAEVTPSAEVPAKNDENSDFEGLVTASDYEEFSAEEQNNEVKEEPVVQEDETTSTREIQRLFKEFNVTKLDNNLNDLLHGNIDNYRNILSFLKNNDLISEFEKNEKLFIEMLTCSKAEDLTNVLNIVKSELSVDDEDYKMTLKIVINTIPSIFVSDGGNYENFVQNVKMFKEMGINLISLFDFSKEVFVADHKNLSKNYEITKKYNLKYDYNNVKYLLMLPNIGEKLDYYVESVYQDRTKNNEVFDGVTYINTHPSKLNIVGLETIKRLRYSSENSKKVFGNKPNSLAGEITNLKVNVLDISPEYMNRFFDNKFDTITSDEVREYTKLCRNSSNVKDFANELSHLEKYHRGLRYTINNINVSYNKVVRNYNTLRSYGIDNKKALLFAVCYNLVITNDEYKVLKETLERDGE